MDNIKPEKHPGPFTGPDVVIAHVAVQAALAAIHYLRRVNGS